VRRPQRLAVAWLTQILAVLGAFVPADASFAIPSVRTKIDAQGHVSDPALADALRAALQSLAAAAAARQPGEPQSAGA